MPPLSARAETGYRASGTHANPLGIKTDAPPSLLWDVLRVWVKDHPIKPQPVESVSHAVLSVEPTHEVNFSRAQGARSKAKDNKEARFLPNPQANWGPMVRAAGARVLWDIGTRRGARARACARASASADQHAARMHTAPRPRSRARAASARERSPNRMQPSPPRRIRGPQSLAPPSKSRRLAAVAIRPQPPTQSNLGPFARLCATRFLARVQ